MIRKAFFLTALTLCTFATASADNLKVDDTPAISDSMVYSGKVEIKVKIEIPSLPSEQLRTIALEWVNESLGGVFPGNFENSKVMVDWYGMKFKKEQLEAMEEFGENIPFQDERTFSTLAHTAKFITLQSEMYGYEGGAHGMYGISGITLRASDGRRMDWGIVSEYNETLQRLMRNGLKKYFEVSSDSELQQIIDVENFPHIPLPGCAPLFTKEGIKFQYNPYEIAPYMAGVPEFTIPYSQIKPCLTQTAQRLIE